MMWIVLRTGKVLQYNDAGNCSIEHGTVTLRDRDQKYLIARIPLDIVERAEFYRPCRVMRETKDLRKKARYK